MFLISRLPEFEREVKADPFSLDALIAWLRTKPADETYCFSDTGHCLLAQFFSAAHGIPVESIGTSRYSLLGEGHRRSFPPFFNDIAVTVEYLGTFGNALKRAIAYRDKGANHAL